MIRAVAAGQIIVIGTDGIWDICNAQGEYLGKNRLLTLVGQYARQAPHAIVSSFLEALNAFCGELPVEDDATLVVVRLEC